MTVRRFPDDQQIDQWISTHFLSEADADASPAFDQLLAATADTVSRFQANAPGMVASGLGQWAALNILDHNRSKIRGAVRQIMAAIRPSSYALNACRAGRLSLRRSATSGTTNATGVVCTCRC
jgi:hypothetical protein